MNQELMNLAAQYKLNASEMSEQLKAEMERAMWAMAPPEDRKTTLRRDWLAALLGVGTRPSEERSSILGCGDAAEKLWARIDSKKMLLSTAAKLVRFAKGNLNGSTLSQAIDRELSKYDKLPIVTLVGGVPVRRAAPGIGSKAAEPPPPEPDDPREMFETLRKVAKTYVSGKLKGLDQVTYDKLLRNFERDLKILIQEFRRRVDTAHQRERNTVDVMAVAVSRNKVLEACEILHMDPPRFGQPIDLEKASRQKRQLAGLYHPDSHGGSDVTVSQYHAVIDSFIVLEEYAEQYGSLKNPKAPNSGEESRNGNNPNLKGTQRHD